MKSIGSDIKPVSESHAGSPHFIVDLRAKDGAGSPVPQAIAPAWAEPLPVAKAKASHYSRRPASRPRRETVFMEALPAAAPAARRPSVVPAAVPMSRSAAGSKGPSIATVSKFLLLAVAAIVLLSLNVALPDRVIAIYFVASLLFRIASQQTFLVALIFLVLVAGWSAIGNDVTAQDYAVYAFYFIIIGLAAALRETIWPKGRAKRQSRSSSEPDTKQSQLLR